MDELGTFYAYSAILMIGGNDLPEGVRHFLREYVSSVEQLEILLHLYRKSPEALTSQEVAKALYISPESVAARLDRETRLKSVMHLIRPMGR